ncbi:MAG TPA: SDR family oxidoreductase [Cellvibrio sp.]|nr:SDR family oxidoreductase [Cellvibrio sp.]
MTNIPVTPQKSKSSRKVLIIGCGDIGQRLAYQLSSDKYQITGVRRNCPPNHPHLRYFGCDATASGALEPALKENFDVIVITMTPAERSDAAYQRSYVDTCQNLVNSLSALALQPRLIIFVSSTAVYAQDDGSWVDEDSPTNPTHFSGRRLLEAEKVIQESGFNYTLVRFSGIYGPGRTRLIQQVQQGRASASPHHTNRIHAEDCAGFLAHLIRLQQPLEPMYIATDSHPAPMVEVVSWIAAKIGVTDFLSPDTVNERSNKKLSNKRMLGSGYQLRYPGFQAGYAELIGDGETEQ